MIQRITCKICLGIIVLASFIAATPKHVFGIKLAKFSGWSVQTEKIILQLIAHFEADADADENYFRIKYSVADADTTVLCS